MLFSHDPSGGPGRKAGLARVSESKIKAMFDALDVNQDGIVTLEALLAAVREGHLGRFGTSA